MKTFLGLGEAIKVNAILGLPTFRYLKLVLDVDASRVTSKMLGIYFDLCFQHAATEFPKGVTLSKEDFGHPPRKTTTGYLYWHIVLHLILRW